MGYRPLRALSRQRCKSSKLNRRKCAGRHNPLADCRIDPFPSPIPPKRLSINFSSIHRLFTLFITGCSFGNRREWITYYLEAEIPVPFVRDTVAGGSIYFGAKHVMAYAQLCLVAAELGRYENQRWYRFSPPEACNSFASKRCIRCSWPASQPPLRTRLFGV